MPAEQIVIEFVTDTSQIEGAIPSLQKVGQLSQANALAVQKIGTRSDAAFKSADTSAKNTSKTFSDLEKKAKSLADTLEKGFKSGVADALAEAGASAADFEKVLSEAGLSMDDVQQAAANLTAESDSLKKELREIAKVMAALVKSGHRNSAEYEELSLQASKLKKAIGDANKDIKAFGSDTRGFDKVLMGARGIAGAFAVAQGAAALLDDENEELQKTLLKVNAAMAILQGLKELQELANTREFSSLKVLVGQKKYDALVTNLQTGAESKNIVVRYAAVAAQKALNAVMAITPLGLIALAVGAIAAAWLVFGKNVAAAAEEQAKLNAALDSAGKYLEIDLNAIDRATDRYRQVLKERGASEDELTKAEATGANKRIKRLNDEINAASIALNAIKGIDEENLKSKKELAEKKLSLETQLNDELTALEQKASDFRVKQYQDSLKSYVAFYDARIAETRKGSIAELQAQMDAVKARAAVEKKNNPNLTVGELAKLAAETTRQVQELSSQISISILEDQKALMEAKLATIAEGGTEELEERKRIAAKTAEIELAQLGITENRKVAIRAQAEQEQQEFDRQIAERRMQEELNLIAARVAITREGSEQEYQLQLQALRKQHDIDLNQKGITDSRKQQLTAEYYRKVEEMDREHNLKLTQQAIASRQLEINARLAELERANVSENNAELLRLKKELIDQQTAMEVVAAQNSITNAEQLSAKLKEIWAKNAAEKAAIDEQAKTREIQYNLDITNIVLENAKKRAQVDMTDGNLKKRIAARKEYQRLVIQQINEEDAANDRMWEEGLITYEEYNKKMLEIQGKRIDAELAAEQEKENRKRELISAGYEVLQTGLDAVFDIAAQRRQAELDDTLNKLQKQHDAEINNKSLTEEQKAVIEERYDRRAAQIKRAAWLKERQAKITQAVMNGLLAVTNALATAPTILAGIPLAAVAAATTAISVAKIKSEPIPQFKKGTRRAPKGFAWVGEEGPELVHLKGGERIWTYKESEKIHEAWRGGSVANTDKMLAASIPRVDHELMNQERDKKSLPSRFEIDYSALGKEIAKNQHPVSVINKIDQDGLALWIEENRNKTNIRNQRYTFNR